MKLRLEIDLDNAAFGESNEERGVELARIFHHIASNFETQGAYPMRESGERVRDDNGNTVGNLLVR